jgi:uncharacterized protein YbjT (DUF2867 family)
MYVIAGVTGKTGAVVAGALLDAGKQVRVLVRDAARGEPWRARGAEVAVASLDDERSVRRALDGASAAYLLSPQDFTAPDPITTGWKIAHAVARALEGGSVGHLVFLSSLHAPLAEGTGLALTLHAAEERLAGLATPITFVRAAYFLENWAFVLGAAAAGKLPTFLRPERALAMVSVRDVGAAAARLLLEGPPARRRVVALHGPRDYSPRDLAGILGQLLGTPVEPAHAPLEAVVPAFVQLGASPGFAEQVRQMYQGLEAREAPALQPDERLLRGTVTAQSVFEALLAGPRS